MFIFVEFLTVYLLYERRVQLQLFMNYEIILHVIYTVLELSAGGYIATCSMKNDISLFSFQYSICLVHVIMCVFSSF